MAKIVVMWMALAAIISWIATILSIQHVQGFFLSPPSKSSRSRDLFRRQQWFQQQHRDNDDDDEDSSATTTLVHADANDDQETKWRSLLDQAVIVQYQEQQSLIQNQQQQPSTTAIQLSYSPPSSSICTNLIGDIARQLYFQSIAPKQLNSIRIRRQQLAQDIMNHLLLQRQQQQQQRVQHQPSTTPPSSSSSLPQLDDLGRDFQRLSRQQDYLQQVILLQDTDHANQTTTTFSCLEDWNERLETLRQPLFLPPSDNRVDTTKHDNENLESNSVIATTTNDENILPSLMEIDYYSEKRLELEAQISDVTTFISQNRQSSSSSPLLSSSQADTYHNNGGGGGGGTAASVTNSVFVTPSKNTASPEVPPFFLLETSQVPSANVLMETSIVTDKAVDNQETTEPAPTSTNISTAAAAAASMSKQDVDNLLDSNREDVFGEMPYELLDSMVDADADDDDDDTSVEEEVVDVAIVGAGIGGLCAGAILNTLYGKKVGIYESHYLAGGCAHAFERSVLIPTTTEAPNNNIDNNDTAESQQRKRKLTFTFDSGPTILLGCSEPPYNPLRQVLNAIDESVEWIRYDGWGMIERPGKPDELRWKVTLGPDEFEQGPLTQFGGGESAVEEFHALQDATKGLLSGVGIPAMAMRPGKAALVPLLRYFPTLLQLIQQGPELTTGTFAPFLDGPLFVVKNAWLRNWLDALAFSLSGLPACRTSAAAMAFVLYDMHRPGAALDYPKGGLGAVIDALVAGVEKGNHGSKVNLRSHVQRIDWDGIRITGLTLKGGKRIKARDGVICNAPLWSLNKLIHDDGLRELLNNKLQSSQQAGREPRQTWVSNTVGSSSIRYVRPVPDPKDNESLLAQCDMAEMTGSFMHLHLAINSTGLDMNSMEAHYTVMDRSLAGDGSVVNGVTDGPCGELNMIAVSNPCVIDKSLAPEGFMIVHAYAAANEPSQLWQGIDRNSPKYRKLKEERSQVLWRAVESIIPDVRSRVVLDLTGSPLTHERFLRRPKGTYGAATEDVSRTCLYCTHSIIDILTYLVIFVFHSISEMVAPLSNLWFLQVTEYFPA